MFHWLSRSLELWHLANCWSWLALRGPLLLRFDLVNYASFLHPRSCCVWNCYLDFLLDVLFLTYFEASSSTSPLVQQQDQDVHFRLMAILGIPLSLLAFFHFVSFLHFSLLPESSGYSFILVMLTHHSSSCLVGLHYMIHIRSTLLNYSNAAIRPALFIQLRELLKLRNVVFLSFPKISGIVKNYYRFQI